MKTFVILFFCTIIFSISNAQDADIIGTWNIIEFTVNSDENGEKKTEDKLKEDGSIWELFFNEDGKIKQTSNMRTGTIETQEGTWNTSDANLTLILEFNDRDIELNYMYELKENILVLKRSNPMKTMEIISKFRKK